MFDTDFLDNWRAELKIMNKGKEGAKCLYPNSLISLLATVHVCVCIPRKMVVIEQIRDMKRWKKKHEYGMRWIAESAFSSIKRTFGEYVSSIKWNNIVNELLLKASIYNMLFVDKMMMAAA